MTTLDLDFPFTERDTPALRARIGHDLATIAERARRADPSLRALALTGGFSRGEGTARDDVPVNDYDLIAIRDRPGGAARYRSLARELHKALGIEVDIMPVWGARLPRVGRKLFWLDMRLGGRVIFGDASALSRLPRFTARDLARSEVARLLGNRAAGMILSIPGRDEPVDPDLRDLQATKAALAAMDATLLARGEYAPKMRERLEMARGHRDAGAFAIAVEWKLRGAPVPEDWWERARDALLRAVDKTHARAVRDGALEHAMHAIRARRIVPSPSQAIRQAAWDMLAMSAFPEGPSDVAEAARTMRRIAAPALPSGSGWSGLKRAFFAARDRTLQ